MPTRFETSWYQFAKEIHRQAAELGFPLAMKKIEPITTKEYPTPAQRPSYSTLSTKKIEEHLGRAPRPWQEALNDYLVQIEKRSKNAAGCINARPKNPSEHSCDWRGRIYWISVYPPFAFS